MRLINIDTMRMEQFSGEEIPGYLILSHTWGADEISFQDYSWLQNYDEEVTQGIMDEFPDGHRRRARAKSERLRGSSGYKKIMDFAAQARLGNFWKVKGDEEGGSEDGNRAAADPPRYIWVDTCCINKESSAELSEAINSMYEWYQRSVLCVAYLDDVWVDTATRLRTEDGSFIFIPEVAGSRWFTRGWTLQELLAPRDVWFCNHSWFPIGTKRTRDWEIFRKTGIRPEFVNGSASLDDASVAARMSWAAGRQTTRVEDEAYCLMGLFGVNMPLLYGEGKEAFRRLQEEIIKRSGDQSIFAWRHRHAVDSDRNVGVFAGSPDEFRGLGAMASLQVDVPYQMTNLGLQITADLVLFRHQSEGWVNMDTVYMLLPELPPDMHGKVTRLGFLVEGQGTDVRAFDERVHDGVVLARVSGGPPVEFSKELESRLRKNGCLLRRTIILRPEDEKVPALWWTQNDIMPFVLRLGPGIGLAEVWSGSSTVKHLVSARRDASSGVTELLFAPVALLLRLGARSYAHGRSYALFKLQRATGGSVPCRFYVVVVELVWPSTIEARCYPIGGLLVSSILAGARRLPWAAASKRAPSLKSLEELMAEFGGTVPHSEWREAASSTELQVKACYGPGVTEDFSDKEAFLVGVTHIA